jgi:hypothetical protein
MRTRVQARVFQYVAHCTTKDFESLPQQVVLILLVLLLLKLAEASRHPSALISNASASLFEGLKLHHDSLVSVSEALLFLCECLLASR